MKVHFAGSSIAVLAASALSLSASTGGQLASTGQTDVLTVTGCLRENPVRSGAYVLESVEGEGAEKAYRLIGSANAELRAHVGQRVKVIGTVAKAGPGGESATMGASGRQAPDKPGMNVTLVSKLADSCGASTR